MPKPSAAGLKGVSRPPLARMLRIHEELKRNRYPNCSQLAAKLEYSAKTIQRDIDFMRDRLDLPIAFDRDRNGFHYTAPVANFPTVQVTEGELVAMFVAEKALAQYRGTPFEKPLHAAFQKLTEGLRDEVTFSWSELDHAISFRPLGATVADLEQFETVSSAVLQSRELEFEYHKLNSAGFEKRRAQPCHLGCVENQWYLFAFDLDRQQMRTFALPRMRQARATGKRFARSQPFSITDHLAGSFGVFAAGETPQEIRIWFDPWAARLVRERVWHASQRIKDLLHGEIELSFKLAGIPEVFRWILSWGEHARVRAPDTLRRAVQQTAAQVARMHAPPG